MLHHRTARCGDLWHQNCSSTSPLALLVQLLPLTVFYPAVRMAFFFIFVKARPPPTATCTQHWRLSR